jgi:sigma-B regulation protein RsbU (phosphoserine phosphatase)
VLLHPGQSVLLYTDGVTEAMNIQGECYGEQRLKDCIQSLRDATPFDIIRRIHSDLIRFSGNAPRADDITMLVFARTPHAAARPAGELPR